MDLQQPTLLFFTPTVSSNVILYLDICGQNSPLRRQHSALVRPGAESDRLCRPLGKVRFLLGHLKYEQ